MEQGKRILYLQILLYLNSIHSIRQDEDNNRDCKFDTSNQFYNSIQPCPSELSESHETMNVVQKTIREIEERTGVLQSAVEIFTTDLDKTRKLQTVLENRMTQGFEEMKKLITELKIRIENQENRMKREVEGGKQLIEKLNYMMKQHQGDNAVQEQSVVKRLDELERVYYDTFGRTKTVFWGGP